MPKFADHLTDIGDILLSTATEGEVRVNLGNHLTGDGYDTNASMWGPDGYIARPNDPDDDGAARALYLVDGNARRVIATTDHRFSAQAGTLEPGDRLVVTNAACRWFMKQSTAHVGMYTEAESEPPVGGKGMILSLDGAGSVMQFKFGGTLIVLDGSTVTILAADNTSQSSIVLTPTSVTITASTVNIAGGFVTLGRNSDGTAPGKPGIDNVLYGAMGQSGISSPYVYAAAY
jgi:hypothetical protein